MRSNSSCIEGGNAARQRSLELIERHARLQRRRRGNQIGDGLRLHEIDAPLRNARSVNSPGSREARTGGNGARARSLRSTIGLPCALISTTSSPV